jgi:hypothetical protein
MSKTVSLHWYNSLQDKILSAIDNTIATPVHNEQVIWDLEHQEPCPGPDVQHPYPSINDSPYAALSKGSVIFLALFGIIFSLAVTFYRKLRRQENASQYHFFAQLQDDAELKKLLSSNSSVVSEYDIHLSIAYFYNPDIPAFILWIRRKWASMTNDNRLQDLQSYFNFMTKQPKKNKALLLEASYKKINEKLAEFITNKKIYGTWKAKKQTEKWTIEPEANFENLQAWLEKKALPETNKSHAKQNTKTVWQLILDFIEIRLQELGGASFVYWIGVFVFYFLPGLGIVGGVVLPPILIASAFLLAVWATKIYATWHRKQEKFNIANINNNGDPQASAMFLQLVKQQLLMDNLFIQRTATEGTPIDPANSGYVKVKFREKSREEGEEETRYEESKLCKDIRETLKRRSDFRFVWSFFNGFVGGCFTIFFSFWLLGSILSLFISLSPVVVFSITLGLGLVYGIYSAVKYYNHTMQMLLGEKAKFVKLVKEGETFEIPNISLRECDRFFRSGKVQAMGWTAVKQVCNRAWTGFVRFGTGLLFFRLLPWGTVATILTALNMGALPAFSPLLIIMLTGGLFFAGWHVWQYHCVSKENQATRVMRFLLHYPARLKMQSAQAILLDKTEADEEHHESTKELSQELIFESSINDTKTYVSSSKQKPIQIDIIRNRQPLERVRRVSGSAPSLVSLENTTLQNKPGSMQFLDIKNKSPLMRKRSNSTPVEMQTKKPNDYKKNEELKLNRHIIFEKKAASVSKNQLSSSLACSH